MTRLISHDHEHRNSGQAIVLVALGMAGLLAILGLAIDAGGMYFLYRDAQNAVDAAAVAGAYALCTASDAASVQNAALDAAERHGFDNNAVDNWVTVNTPPLSGQGAGDPSYVEVEIQARKPAFLIQMVYSGPLELTVRGVTRCKLSTEDTPADAYAVFAGSTTCTNAIDWPSNVTNIVGDLHSNTDIDQPGNNNTVAGEATASDSLSRMGQNNYYNGTKCTGSQPECPDTGVATKTMPVLYEIEDFQTGGVYASDNHHYHNAGSNEITAQYLRNQGLMSGSTINPGVYYTTGNIKLNENGMNVGTDDDGRTGVTFVTSSGTISVSGNDHDLEPWSGTNNLLFFSNKCSPSSPCGNNCNTTVIQLNGTSHEWNGIIYAPYGRVETNGEMSNTKLEGCIYANTVRLNGNGVSITCEKSDAPTIPQVLFAE